MAGSNGLTDQATLTSLQSAGLDDDIIYGADGMAVFWPDEAGGAYSAHELRAIADYLDSMNADWLANIAAASGMTPETLEGE